MDAFFAAVEERNNPQWAGKPIVVGADPHSPAGAGTGRGVVSTANYAARALGIHSGQPITRAWKVASPDTIFVPGNWKAYSDTSKRIMEIIRKALIHPTPTLPSLEGRDSLFNLPLKPAPWQSFTGRGGDAEGVILQTGIDEWYFDLSFLASNPAWSGVEKLCREIKQAILAREKLTCSIGIGPNKLVAKIAANFQKPDGITVVPPASVEAFLDPLSVRDIPGVGPKTETILNQQGIHTIKHLRQHAPEQAIHLLTGSTDLSTPGPAKSISQQRTFFRDTRDAQTLTSTILDIAKNLHASICEEKRTFRTVTVTIRFANFETHTSSRTLKQPTRSLSKLNHEALRLLLPFLDHRQNPRNQAIRLVGLKIEKLISLPNSDRGALCPSPSGSCSIRP